VNLSSSGHCFSNVDLKDPNFVRTTYEPFIGYGRSKTAKHPFLRSPLTSGIERLASGLGRCILEVQALIDQITKQLAAEGKPPFKFKTIPQGAATSVWAGVVATADEIGGRYCENCHVSHIVPEDVPITPVSEGVRGYALDPSSAAVLWKKSGELVGESFS
jgi:hypothetical protein